MRDDYDVPMDDPIIKEPAPAPPQPSAIALGKHPAVDKPTSAPPCKVPSISMVTASSGAPTLSKSYSSVASSAAGLPLTLVQTTAVATSGFSGANACSTSTQLGTNSPSAITALHRRFPPTGVLEVVAAQHAATHVAQMDHPVPRANPMNPWQGTITAKQLNMIWNMDLPHWQVLMETADAHWAHPP
ncbi:hypothetical protein DACRYDRAFT_108720 [Dacryopinax primogenitus]|uniref:Uncharacterized protein n=1 Tax=Dacryopinax primogenitus (strain DJM 731) TaxID=1858805 RepID=M5FXY9_DACPD|nr:uncharacterized protein DACRYDRAFT_108720 [Dacryopinax primogenitus]EJU00650.1 hypothetical protein DACRYDRAFT_108720 [Dacryopinax primogenitus]